MIQNWSQHIKTLSEQLSPLIGAFRRCTRLSNHLAKQVYNCVLLSKIQTNINIWSGCGVTKLEIIKTLMYRALRTLFKLNFNTNRKEVYEISKAMSLESLIEMNNCKLVFKLKNGFLKSNINLELQSESHGHFTRRRADIQITKSRTNNMNKGVLNLAICSFNKLPEDLKTEKDLKKFLCKLKKHIELTSQ